MAHEPSLSRWFKSADYSWLATASKLSFFEYEISHGLQEEASKGNIGVLEPLIDYIVSLQIANPGLR